MTNRQLSALVGLIGIALAGHLVVDVRQDDPASPADINWYCGDPDDVAWGGQVVVVHCRQHESMLDGNDGENVLAEMDLWLNADGLREALEEAKP